MKKTIGVLLSGMLLLGASCGARQSATTTTDTATDETTAEITTEMVTDQTEVDAALQQMQSAQDQAEGAVAEVEDNETVDSYTLPTDIPE